MNPFESAYSLLAQLDSTPLIERWSLPFPLAVFGTLRHGFCNHHLMRRSPIAHHCRALLPHFYAQGIELFFRQGSTCPFEIFVFEPDTWCTVMPSIEELEEFVPGRLQERGYHRTLAWFCLLPTEQQHPAFDCDLAAERDLQLPPEQWQYRERVPCWVYSSLAQNRLAAGVEDSPLIWDGTIHRGIDLKR